MKKNFIFFFLIKILFCACQVKVPNGGYLYVSSAKNMKCETTATCVKNYHSNEKTQTLWAYTVNGKVYTEKGDYCKIVGTAYIIKYDSLFPENFMILNSKPIFYNDEKTETATGTILKVDKKYIKYKWNFEKYKHISTQYIDNEINGIKKGDTATVEYWVNNPGRCILILKDNNYEIRRGRPH